MSDRSALSYFRWVGWFIPFVLSAVHSASCFTTFERINGKVTSINYDPWIIPGVLFILALIFVIYGWWPYLFGKGENVLPDLSLDEDTWNEESPEQVYGNSVFTKIAAVLVLLGIPAFLVFAHPGMLKYWYDLLVFFIFIVMFFMSVYLDETKVYRNGIIKGGHPFIPFRRMAWKEIERVTLTWYSTKSGRVYVLKLFGNDKMAVLSFEDRRKPSIIEVRELVKKHRGEHVMDKEVLEWNGRPKLFG